LASCFGATHVYALDMTNPNEGGTMQGYAQGFEYGSKVGARMSPERRRHNDRYVRSTEHVARGSVTRGYWLGFRRALRGLS